MGMPQEYNKRTFKPTYNLSFARSISIHFGGRKQTILTHLAQSGKKWSQYDNRKRLSQWLHKDESPKHTPKRSIYHKKKMTASVYWSSACDLCRSQQKYTATN
uniref:Uncharacterized protein n=1 Tax=Glossina pallidipes TaxID=7398 RepID=A0A1A9ZUC4_GLOPL